MGCGRIGGLGRWWRCSRCSSSSRCRSATSTSRTPINPGSRPLRHPSRFNAAAQHSRSRRPVLRDLRNPCALDRGADRGRAGLSRCRRRMPLPSGPMRARVFDSSRGSTPSAPAHRRFPDHAAIAARDARASPRGVDLVARSVRNSSCQIRVGRSAAARAFRIDRCVARRRTPRTRSHCRKSMSPRRARSCGAPRHAARPRPPRPRRPSSHRGAAARHAADRHRPVRHRDSGAARGNRAQPRHDARRRAVRQARHHRLELCAGRVEPADRARPRRQPRRHRRQRHRRRRRVGPGRRPFRAGQSAGDRADRGDPRAGDAALRLAVDRRRGQPPATTASRRHCPAGRSARYGPCPASPRPRRCLPLRRAAARSRRAPRCRASTTAARAACCSTPAPATSPSTPMPSAAAPRTTACRAIPI